MLEQLLEQLPTTPQLTSYSITAIVMPGIAIPSNNNAEPSIPIEQSPDLSSLAGLAAVNDIPVLRTKDCNEDKLPEDLTQLDADIFLLACFPLKLPRNIWQLPKLACWNIHPSLLPEYRGPSPIHWQLKNKEKNTGITLHQVAETLDAGDIVAQSPYSMPSDVSSTSLDSWVAVNGINLFMQALLDYRNNKLTKTKQIESEASYFPYP